MVSCDDGTWGLLSPREQAHGWWYSCRSQQGAGGWGRLARVFTCVSPQVKQKDNGVALKCFQRVVSALDALDWEERQLALVKGLLAGNVFDWGAKAVSE